MSQSLRSFEKDGKPFHFPCEELRPWLEACLASVLGTHQQMSGWGKVLFLHLLLLFLLLYFKFWDICAKCEGLLHRYTRAMWFVAPINLSSTLGTSNAVFSLALRPPTGLDVWCSLPCVHVFSMFNSYLGVRTCGVWFAVPVLVCWEWWFPDSSKSLQRIQTH